MPREKSEAYAGDFDTHRDLLTPHDAITWQRNAEPKRHSAARPVRDLHEYRQQKVSVDRAGPNCRRARVDQRQFLSELLSMN